MAIYLRYGKAFITYWRISPRGFPRRTVSPKRFHMGTRTTYRIVVHGEPSERYAAVFEGMEAASGRMVSVESVPVKSQ